MNTQKAQDGTVGIVLVTHGDFGKALLNAAETIMGKQAQCVFIGVDISQSVEVTLALLRKAVEEVDTGSGTLILTDMFGGTPANISLSLIGSGNFEVLTGVSLPVLLKIFSDRNISLARLALEAKEAGIQGIVVAGEVLRRKIKAQDKPEQSR